MFWKANRHGAIATKDLDSTFSALAGLALFTTAVGVRLALFNRYANIVTQTTLKCIGALLSLLSTASTSPFGDEQRVVAGSVGFR